MPRLRRPRPGDRPLRILMVASEVQPYSKTGGLADVAGALPRALGALGHHVTVVTPRYRGIDAGQPSARMPVRVGSYGFDTTFRLEATGATTQLVFVDVPALYGREGIYNERNVDYADNALRYAFLSMAALAWASTQPAVDVVHAHDWQAGLVPVYVRAGALAAPEAHDSPAARPPVVLTIHNLAYQGIFDKRWVPFLGLPWNQFRLEGFEYWDRLSFLKAGVSSADLLTTVSPTYAREVQRPEYGYGLDGAMRARSDALVGILNGIDPDEWNPATDPHLPVPYTAQTLGRKGDVKRALLELFGLPTDDGALARPVVGMVSRMVDQKGFDLLEQLATRLFTLDAAFVFVGTGEPRYQQFVRRLQQWRPDRVSAFIGFDERRAHLVEGGSDIFLMPSRYEPCGLNQMYSLRYGTVPVVRATGGLADTVVPFDARTGEGTGFVFGDYSADALYSALAQGIAAHAVPPLWRRLQKNGMRQDFSWARSASEYVKVYNRVIDTRDARAARLPTAAHTAGASGVSTHEGPWLPTRSRP